MLFSTAIKRKETNTPGVGVCRVSGCTRVRGGWLRGEGLHTRAGRVAAGGGARALHLSHAVVNTALGSCHAISPHSSGNPAGVAHSFGPGFDPHFCLPGKEAAGHSPEPVRALPGPKPGEAVPGRAHPLLSSLRGSQVLWPGPGQPLYCIKQGTHGTATDASLAPRDG